MDFTDTPHAKPTYVVVCAHHDGRGGRSIYMSETDLGEGVGEAARRVREHLDGGRAYIERVLRVEPNFASFSDATKEVAQFIADTCGELDPDDSYDCAIDEFIWGAGLPSPMKIQAEDAALWGDDEYAGTVDG